MAILPVCMSGQHLHVVPKEARRGLQSPGTGVLDCCELPCDRPKLGPLKEQSLPIATGLSVSPTPQSY